MVKIVSIVAIVCLSLILFSSLASAAIWGNDSEASFSFAESSDDGDDDGTEDSDGGEKEKYGLPNVRIIDEDEEYKQWLGLYGDDGRGSGNYQILDAKQEDKKGFSWIFWFNIVLGFLILLLIIILLFVFALRR